MDRPLGLGLPVDDPDRAELVPVPLTLAEAPPGASDEPEVTITPAADEEKARRDADLRAVAEISRALPNKPVDVTLDGNKVTLTCGASRFTLLTMPVEDYPALPAMSAIVGTVSGDELTSAVAQVSVAASLDHLARVLELGRVRLLDLGHVDELEAEPGAGAHLVGGWRLR